MSSVIRFADKLEAKIKAELLSIGEDPGKAALKGELLKLDSQLAMARFDYQQAEAIQNDYRMGVAADKIYAYYDVFDKLFRPPGMLDFDIQVGF